jgi:hypothetical protein
VTMFRTLFGLNDPNPNCDLYCNKELVYSNAVFTISNGELVISHLQEEAGFECNSIEINQYDHMIYFTSGACNWSILFDYGEMEKACKLLRNNNVTFGISKPGTDFEIKDKLNYSEETPEDTLGIDQYDCEFYEFELLSQSFKFIENTKVAVAFCYFRIPSQEIVQPISREFEPIINITENSFSFHTNNRAICLKFKDIRPFYKRYFHLMFQSGMDKAKDSHIEYIAQALEGFALSESDDEKEEEDDDYSDSEDDFENESNSNTNAPELQTFEQNSYLTVGHRYDKSFVLRGSKIGVFNNTPSNLEFSTTINNITTLDGKQFAPQKMMLHDQESKAFLFSTGENALHLMDLEYGKIIEKWHGNEYTRITDAAPRNKYAQQTSINEVVAVSSNAIMGLDGRLPDNKIANIHSYAKKVGLDCVTTTGSGLRHF